MSRLSSDEKEEASLALLKCDSEVLMAIDSYVAGVEVRPSDPLIYKFHSG